MGGQQEILRRKQRSTRALHNLNNIWTRKNRIKEHVAVKRYKTIVKLVLMYSSQEWGLNDEHNLDSFYCQQLRTALHVRFPHAISNSDLQQQTNEIPLTLAILKNRWKLFGHILFVHPQRPAQQPMIHFFSPSLNSSFKGRQCVTFPITLSKDSVTASEHFSFIKRYEIQRLQSLQHLFIHPTLFILGVKITIYINKKI